MEIIGISHTASAAVKLCKAIPAFLLGIDIAAAEIIRNLRSFDPFVHISHQELFLSYELVTGIQVSPRRNSQVLSAGTAPGKPLGKTRTTVQIDHEMEEIKAFSFLFSLDHDLCQLIVFFHDLRQVLFPDRVRICLVPYHWLNGHLFEAQVCKMQDVF